MTGIAVCTAPPLSDAWLKERDNGPHACVTRGPGVDVENTPGAAIEIKARANLAIPAFIRQAKANAGQQMPVLVLRLNGQGPASIDDWPVVVRLADFVDLWRD